MAKATQINLDTAQRVDIICRKGDTFSLRLTLTTSDTPPVAAFQVADVFRLEVRETDTGELVVNTGGNRNFLYRLLLTPTMRPLSSLT